MRACVCAGHRRMSVGFVAARPVRTESVWVATTCGPAPTEPGESRVKPHFPERAGALELRHASMSMCVCEACVRVRLCVCVKVSQVSKLRRIFGGFRAGAHAHMRIYSGM